MPRVADIYSVPPGTNATPNTAVSSTAYNAFIADLVDDANNKRPIVAGGTGGNTAVSGNDGLNTTSTNIASATTTNLSTVTGVVATVTGTTTITGFGTVASGAERVLIFAGALTLTHNATSLILPGGANIQTAAGDVAHMRSKGSGNWVCVGYQRANGTAVALPTDASFTGNITQTSTDDGAAAAPIHDLYRNSATPAASDVIGARRWTGEDSAGNTETYAEDVAVILDPTSTSEDAKVVRRTVVAGTLADRMHTGAGTWMEGATGGDPGAGKINAIEVQKNGAVLGITSGTPQTTTSGTFKDFTSIPSWVKRISINFVGVSTNGSDELIIQIGDSGGIEPTGYLGTATQLGTSGLGNNFTTGFGLTNNRNANDVSHGRAVLELADASSNTWTGTAHLSNSEDANTFFGTGSKSLSAPLDRIRITTDGGTDAFDAGLINILYD